MTQQDSSVPPIVLEEEGISYLYYNDVSAATTTAAADGDVVKNKPYYIGTKRYAGLYCRACERPLGFSDEKPIKIARAMRKADKNDGNIVAECTQCGAKVNDKKQIIVPCCSFDWHIPPHILERMLHAEQAVSPPKKATGEGKDGKHDGKKKEKNADDDNDSGSDGGDAVQDEASKAKQKQTRKETLLQIESEKPKAVRSTMALPKLSRKGHIENQYGHVISLQEFFDCIVEPCVVRCYDRIPKHCV